MGILGGSNRSRINPVDRHRYCEASVADRQLTTDTSAKRVGATMAVMKKGNFSIDIGFLKLGADFEESDRQCAWELYTELATRIAVTGKSKDRDCTDFSV